MNNSIIYILLLPFLPSITVAKKFLHEREKKHMYYLASRLGLGPPENGSTASESLSEWGLPKGAGTAAARSSICCL